MDRQTFRITLQEGRNRQIRRMCEALGYVVMQLHREEVAGISLQGLQEGQWKQLSAVEMRTVSGILNTAKRERNIQKALEP